MGNLVEYSSLQSYEAQRNTSENDNSSTYNFTGADEILMSFKLQFQKIDYSEAILLSLYVPTFTIAVIGNPLVIGTLASQKWRAKHVYLLNLAVRDLLVTLMCMPSTVVTIVNRLWVSGLILCKLASFLQGVAIATGIFTLASMSVDCYISFQHRPNAHWTSSPRHAGIVIAVMWLVSMVFMTPQLYIRTIDTLSLPTLPNMTFCIEQWPSQRGRETFGWLFLIVVYVIPVVTVAVCYANVGKIICSYTLTREDSNTSDTSYVYCRKRAARILILLVILFMVCWLPYNVMSLAIDLADVSWLVPFLPYALWLGHAHSAINPALYWATNRRFREIVARIYGIFKNPKSFWVRKRRRPRIV